MRVEQRFIRHGVQQGIRADGRGRNDFRPLAIETGLLPQANGSARVKMVGLCGNTEVVAGIKAVIGAPNAATPASGHVAVAVECLSMASPR